VGVDLNNAMLDVARRLRRVRGRLSCSRSSEPFFEDVEVDERRRSVEERRLLLGEGCRLGQGDE
jgi:hypothetical protein